MPPRGGRGRGRGRVAKSTATPRKQIRYAGNINNGRLHDADHQSNGQNGHSSDVHAFIDHDSGLLIIAGLHPSQFPDFEFPSSESDDAESDASDYESAANAKTSSARKRAAVAAAAANAEGQVHDGANPSTASDWTESDVEVWVAPKSRGFYRPPKKREVVRQKVRRNESSRYNPDVAKCRAQSPDPEPVEAEGEILGEENGHVNGMGKEDSKVPFIVEQEATEDEVEKKIEVKEGKQIAKVPGRRGRKKKTPEPALPRPEIIDEGELSDSNFPEPYLPRQPVPPARHFKDKADWIMKKKFRPMNDPQAFISALTKLDPATRSTEVLYALALNAQQALKAWQDEYLELDLFTAPRSNPPRKPLTGGRAIIDPDVYDAMLEADLYGYTYDPKKPPDQQDPFRQRAGGGKFVGGRELRQRRARDVGAADMSEVEMDNTEGYGTRNRRRAAQRQDDSSGSQLAVPPRSSLKRTVSTGASGNDGLPRKRGRPSAADRNAMSRVQQLREDSQAPTNVSEPEGHSVETSRRRGRPPGSKNTMPRSDAGIKKGPRKRPAAALDGEDASQVDTETPVTTLSAQTSMEIDDAAEGSMNGTSEAQGTMMNDADGASNSTDTPAADGKEGKPRVRSEKRSKSMTEWWAARKAKAAEDRKQQLAAQAEVDRQAEEQARAAHAAHEAQFPQQDTRYWPQLAPQNGHQSHAYPGPPPRPPAHVTFTGGPPLAPYMAFSVPPPSQPLRVASTGPQPSKDMFRPPEQSSRPPPPPPPPPPQYHHVPIQNPPPEHRREERHMIPPPHPVSIPHKVPIGGPPSSTQPPNQQPLAQSYFPRALAPLPLQGPLSFQRPPSRHDISSLLGPPALSPGPPRTIRELAGLPHSPITGSPRDTRPLTQTTQTQHKLPSFSLAASPRQPAQQHVFHHHPAAPPPPPPPPAPLQASRPPEQQAGPGRQASPLRRIVNYVSDPSKAAQPAGPPYQTIMTPGVEPNVIQHSAHQQSSRPASRGRTPPRTSELLPPPASSAAAAPAGNFTGAFHVNNGAGRVPIPGTGSFRPDTPSKSTFTHYTVYTPPNGSRPPQGRMTGAQVQDLALAAAQPPQRRSIDEVIREQREKQSLPSSAPPPPPAGLFGRDRGFFRLQPAPQQSLPPLGVASERPPSREQFGRTEPHRPPSRQAGYDYRPITSPGFRHTQYQPASSSSSQLNMHTTLQNLLNQPRRSDERLEHGHALGPPRHLPPLLSFAPQPQLDRDRLNGAAPGKANAMSPPFGQLQRHRSISNGSLGQPLRVVPAVGEKSREGEAKGGTGPAA